MTIEAIGLVLTGIAAILIGIGSMYRRLDLPRVGLWYRLLGTRGAALFYLGYGTIAVVVGFLLLTGILR